MKKEISPELIRKYLAGECSPKELQLVNRWYDSFENEDGLINSLDRKQQLDLKSKMLARVKKNIHQQSGVSTGTVNRKTGNHFQHTLVRYSKIAAIIMLVAGLSFFSSQYLSENPSITKQVSQNKKTPSIIETANHQTNTKKITLSDGSTIWLSASSSIKHPATFENNVREVYLSGEAFFDVKRDTLRPFIIHSGNLTTRVLGTSFTIRAYKGDPNIEVSVVTGKVSVSVRPEENIKPSKNRNINSTLSVKTVKELVLLPNEKATFSNTNLALQRQVIAPLTKKNLWAPASLSFQNTPIRQVIRELNQRFDAEIITANENINKCTIRADFTNQNLPLIIDLICKSIDAEYQMIDKKIIISGEGCSNN